MAINSQTLSSVQNKVTGLTTNETDFRAGLDDTLVQVNANEVKLSEVTTADLTKLNDVTASAVELNVLDGITASTEELNVLNGVTATTSELNLLDGVTATTAEINLLDGITATKAEINKLDGFTGTYEDLNKIAAVTATAEELNKLDGFTGNAADLNRTVALDAAGNGSDGQVLTSDGLGAYSWTTPSSFSWTLEDEDGSEITISTQEIKLTSTGGIDIDWGEGTGTDADPYQLQINNTDKGTDQKIFKSIAVAGNDSLVAATNTDVLTVIGNGVSVSTDTEAGSLTFAILDGSISTSKLADDSVTNAKIEDSAVSTDSLANEAVTETKLGALSVSSTKLQANSVSTTKILNGSVTTDKLADDSVSNAKIAAGAVGDVELANTAITAILSAVYPVGSIYTNAENSTNPATLLGFGTWEVFGAGRVPVGISDGDSEFGTAGQTGGSKTHQLTVDEMPSHNHGLNLWAGPPDWSYIRPSRFSSGSGPSLNEDAIQSSGGNQPHNILQPYVVVYMWKRTA